MTTDTSEKRVEALIVESLVNEAGPLHNPEAALKVYDALAREANERLARLKADAGD